MIPFVSSLSKKQIQETPVFTTWHAGCHHLKTELIFGYNSISTPIAEVDALFNYDLAIFKGDITSFKEEPDINNVDHVFEYGRVRDALNTTDRSKIYNHGGNHCGGTSQLYAQYVDPRGADPGTSGVINANRPYPITWITDYDYYIDCGHVWFVMITDRNDYPYPVGWINSPEIGGHGSGAISSETWNEIQNLITSNPTKNIILEFHQGIPNTTIGTGESDGQEGNFHGTTGITEWAGAMATIMDEATMTPSTANNEILDFLAVNNSNVVSVHCVHTHHNVGETFDGKGFRHQQSNIEFINLGQCNKHATLPGYKKERSSWRLEVFEDKIRYTRILHESITRGSVTYPKGFYTSDQFEINLKTPL